MKSMILIVGWMISLTCFSLPEKTISTDDLNQGPVPLHGLWAFDWLSLHTDIDAPMQDALLLPGLWHKQGTYNPHGFATLRLRLNMPLQQRYYLRIPDMPSAMRLWVNGELILQRGMVSTNIQTEQPKFGPEVIALTPAKQYDLILQISNYHHKEGGVWHNLLIASEPHRHALRNQGKLIDAMVFSFLMLVSLYLLVRNLSRHGYVSHLFFALFVWAIALRSIMVGERIVYDFISFISWENWQRLEHILLFLALPMLIYFFNHFFEIKRKLYSHLVSILSIALITTTILTPSYVFTQLAMLNQLMWTASCVYMLVMLVLLKKQNVPFSGTFLMSFIGWAGFMLHDYLYTHLHIQSRPLAQFGLVFFVAFQFYILWQYRIGESRLLSYVKDSVDRSSDYLREKYTKSSSYKVFSLKEWLKSITLHCNALDLLVYVDDDTVVLPYNQDQLRDIVLILARMAQRDGISVSLCIRLNDDMVRFEFILDRIIHNQEMLNDEMNAVYYALNDMGVKLNIERLSTTTCISFNLLSHSPRKNIENSKVEFYGNNFSDPVLLNDDYLGVVTESLQDYFYLIKSNITKDNLIKYRPKLIIWQVLEWNAYVLEDIKRIRNEHESIPIILILDSYQKVQLAQCIRMGIVDYVISPVLPEELLLKVQRVNNNVQVEIQPHRDVRDITVQLVRDSIALWKKYSNKTKIDLAESSRLWRVYMDGSTAKTRTLDKYLSIQTLPKNPRWETVSSTVNYVLEHCELNDTDKNKLLEQLALFEKLIISKGEKSI